MTRRRAKILKQTHNAFVQDMLKISRSIKVEEKRCIMTIQVLESMEHEEAEIFKLKGINLEPS